MQPENRGNYGQPQSEAPLQVTEFPPTQSPVAPPAALPAADPTAQTDPDQTLSWEASEYIHHEKEWIWFLPVIGGGLALLAVSIFLLQSITFSVLIVVMTIALSIYAVRPPRIMRYELSPLGVRINEKSLSFRDFRSFGIVQDGPLYSALLTPNKRFMPTVTVYFPAEYGERVVDLLGSYIPMQNVELDFVDKLMRKFRF